MPPTDVNNPASPPRPSRPTTEPYLGGPLSLPGMTPVLAPETASAEPAGLAAPPTFAGLVQALRRRWQLALGVATAGALLTVAAVFLVMPPRYTVQSRLKLTSAPDGLLFSDRQMHHNEPTLWKGNQEAILKSPLILSRALDSDKLKGLPIARESVDWLERALKVDFLLGPEIMRIVLSGDDAEGLAPLLNAVVDAYLADMNQQEYARRAGLLKELEESQKVQLKKLWKAEAELRREERDHGIDNPESAKFKYQNAMTKLNAVEKEYRDLKSEMGKKRRELQNMQTRDRDIKNEPVPAFKVDQAVRESPLSQGALKQLELVDLEIAELQRTATPDKVEDLLKRPLADKTAILVQFEKLREVLRPGIEERLRGEIQQTLKTDIARLEGEIAGLASQERGLNDAVKRSEDDVRRLDPVNQPRTPLMERLRGDIAQLTKAVDNLTTETAKLKVEPPPSDRVIRLQAAEPPTGRDYGRQTKIGLAGGMSTFGLLLFGVAFREFRTRKVTRVGEVAQGLGMNVLGTLPALPARARGAAAGGPAKDPQWQSAMNESVDAVRTLLLHTARAGGLQVIMVTSAGGGEGKTSVASQLAASLARAWRKTLLVDGDLRNPAAHKLFDLPLEPGLSEVLRGEAGASDVVKPTPLSRLWMVPAGHWDSHAVQALAQDGVRTLFAQLKQQYEFIIVDSCPVLPVADALLLGQNVDGVVFSVLRDVSRLPAVRAAQQRLGALGVRTLGAVVIGADGDGGNAAYQYPAQPGA